MRAAQALFGLDVIGAAAELQVLLVPVPLGSVGTRAQLFSF